MFFGLWPSAAAKVDYLHLATPGIISESGAGGTSYSNGLLVDCREYNGLNDKQLLERLCRDNERNHGPGRPRRVEKALMHADVPSPCR